MGTTLHTLKGNKGANRKRKRIGRGVGSGHGQTAGKGTKGQKARTGHHGARIGFEGGQMPMQRRLPKRGFKNPFRKEAFAINVGALAERFGDVGTVDVDAMKNAGMVPRTAPLVKVLGEGDVAKKLTVRAHAFSETAKAKLEKAGGVAEVVKPETKKDKAAQPATT
jgi:large subunit ribosomal protein L15